MEFEFDPAKSAANNEKHGIDFVEAQALWYDDYRIDVEASHDLETRWITVGRIRDKLWTGVYTMRGNVVRIISVRRARLAERLRYAENNR
jgi:uncharacterized protein